MSDGGGLQKKQKKFEQKAAKEAKTSKWARASLLSKKSSKKGLTRRHLFLVRVGSLVCTVEMIGPSRSAGAGRDALPRVRRCTSRRFFLLLQRTRTCAIGAEALSLSCFLSLHLRWTCGAGARGSASWSASLPVATASTTQIGKPKASSPRCSLLTL